MCSSVRDRIEGLLFPSLRCAAGPRRRLIPLYFHHAKLAKVALRVLASLAIAAALNTPIETWAGDLPGSSGYVTPSSAWQFRVTPYAWAPSVNGDVTVRGQTADIDMSFWDLFNSGSSGAELNSLAALMGYVEARKGPWGIYGDVVLGQIRFLRRRSDPKEPHREFESLGAG